MSQQQLGDLLGLSFQQVQKYEKGTNRIGASRLQQIALILNVSITYFFEGAPTPSNVSKEPGAKVAPDYVNAFLTDIDGLALTKAFMRIKKPGVKRAIVSLVKKIADEMFD
jgi:transcriptional regulator with XRE-family HTH domain